MSLKRAVDMFHEALSLYRLAVAVTRVLEADGSERWTPEHEEDGEALLGKHCRMDVT